MKIVLLHYSVPPVVGGVESVLGHHACLMADDGKTVIAIAGRGEQFDPRVPFVHLPLVDSIHPDVLKLKKELDAGRVPNDFERLTDKILAELKATCRDVDVLIAHNVASLNKNLALTAALYRLSQSPNSPRIILWHHDLAWTTPRCRAELHDGYPWGLLKTRWENVKQVVVSQLRQRELAELYQMPSDEIAVVPNGVDAPSFLGLQLATIEIANKLDLWNASPILLLPVRITPRKNIELALATLAELRRDFPNAALVVTGPLGPHNPKNVEYFAKLREQRERLQLQAHAHFLSEHSDTYLPDAVVADFYRLADALLLPSREEGFGIPIIEAGLSGLPVFCADIPPLREIGGEHVWYFSPEGDPNQVGALIADQLSASRIHALRARVWQRYSWGRVYRANILPILAGE